MQFKTVYMSSQPPHSTFNAQDGHAPGSSCLYSAQGSYDCAGGSEAVASAAAAPTPAVVTAAGSPAETVEHFSSMMPPFKAGTNTTLDRKNK